MTRIMIAGLHVSKLPNYGKRQRGPTNRRENPRLRMLRIWEARTSGAALAASGLPVPELVKRTGLDYAVIQSRMTRGAGIRPPAINNATDRATRVLLDDITASGMPDTVLARKAGVGARTIQGWRRGRTATPFLVECVREALTKNTPGY